MMQEARDPFYKTHFTAGCTYVTHGVTEGDKGKMKCRLYYNMIQDTAARFCLFKFLSDKHLISFIRILVIYET